MQRKAKALGLALAAAFALSAVAASAASAVTHTFSTPGYAGTTFLTAKQYTEGNTENIHGEELNGVQEFQAKTNDTRTIKCKKLTASGLVIKEVSSDVTLTPKYEECSAWETKDGVTKEVSSAFVQFTSCSYLFKGGTNSFSEGTEGEHATVNIHCNISGDFVHIKVTALKLTCITLPEQTIGQGVRYFNEETEPNNVVIHATAHGIESETPGTIACPGKATHTTGTYTGEATVSAFKNEAHTEPQSIEVTGAGLTSEG